MVVELNSDSFKTDVLENTGVTVVDFWAPWCGPCRMMAPIIDAVAGKVTEAKFAKLNTDEYQDLAAEYRITGIPCLIVFKGGKEVARLVGVQPADVLEKKVKGYL